MLSAFLRRPYPFNENIRSTIVTNFLIGLFVALFLIIFQPFSINLWQTDHKLWKLAGFGLISFAIPLTLTFVIRYIHRKAFPEKQWNTGSEIASILLVLSFIALGNLLYSSFLGTTSISLETYFMTFIVTSLVGVFPVSLHVVRKHHRLLRDNIADADILNQKLKPGNELIPAAPDDELLELSGENEKDRLTLRADELLYIESADNYCYIHHLQKGILKKSILRSSLRRLEQQIKVKKIVRCHRALIVNLEHVKKAEGNAAGYKLYLNHVESSVSVSRSYISVIKEALPA